MDCMTIWNHSCPPEGGLKSALACSLGLGALHHMSTFCVYSSAPDVNFGCLACSCFGGDLHAKREMALHCTQRYTTMHSLSHSVDQQMLVCPILCLSFNSEQSSDSVLVLQVSIEQH